MYYNRLRKVGNTHTHTHRYSPTLQIPSFQALRSVFRGNGRLKWWASVSLHLGWRVCVCLGAIFTCTGFLCVCVHLWHICACVCIYVWGGGRGGAINFDRFSMRVQCVESITIPSIHSSGNNMDVIYMVMQQPWLPPSYAVDISDNGQHGCAVAS